MGYWLEYVFISDTQPTEEIWMSTPMSDPTATDAELTQLAQQMWNADINRFPDGKYALHIQGHTNASETVDRAPRK